MSAGDTENTTAADRVVILARGEADAAALVAALEPFASRVAWCAGIDDFCAQLRRGAAIAVVLPDSLPPEDEDALRGALEQLPAGLEAPVLVAADPAGACGQRLQAAAGGGSRLVGPLPRGTIPGLVRLLLGARRREGVLRLEVVESGKQEAAARGSERQLKQERDVLEERVAARTAEAQRRAELLRSLAAKLSRVEQRERRRLAQMLHDDLQQLLVAARLKLGSLRGRLGDAVLQDSCGEVDRVLEEAIEASRTLTVELHPPILQDAGLGPALQWLGRHAQQKHGLEVEVEVDPQAEPTDEDHRTLLFQSVRELLFNVVKHAGVDKARIIMTRLARERLKVTVADSGVGFDPALLEPRNITDAGFGLFGIRERLESIDGRLEVETAPGQGVRVSLVAPRHRAPAAGAEGGKRESPATEASAPASEARKIRVVLADDHEMLREGLASILSEAGDIEVVGEAGDGQQAVELALRTRPDVVVMDVAMPVLNGIDATRRIRAALPHTQVIGLSMHTREDMDSAMRDAGAATYLPKADSADRLVETIRACAER